MAYTTPRTWVTSELVTAALMNTHVRDNVAFLANPPACRVSRSSTQSLTSGTEATLAFDTEQFDTNSMHSTVSNTERITINTAGIYVFSWGTQLSADTDYLVAYTYLRIGGATIVAHGSSIGTYTDAVGPLLNGSCLYKCAAADYFEVRAFQRNTSAGANTTQAATTFFAATWVGLG
jgi:hypothetical protein